MAVNTEECGLMYLSKSTSTIYFITVDNGIMVFHDYTQPARECFLHNIVCLFIDRC